MDQGEEEVEPDNEFLESEKRRDPIEFAQKYMAKLEELMKPGAVLGPPAEFGRVHHLGAPQAAPIEFHLSVTQISNGWLVSGQGSHVIRGPLTQYVQRQVDLPEAVLKLLRTALGPDPGVSDFRTPPPEGLYPPGGPSSPPTSAI